MKDPRFSIARKRTLVSSLAITILYGVAFEKGVDPVWETFKEKGTSLDVAWLVPYIFVITTFRFLIGNQIHLIKLEEESELFDYIWPFDLVFIMIETFVIIFAGLSCSLDICLENKSRSIGGFFFFITILLLIDIVWILLQWGLGEIHDKWKRKFVPTGWAYLNAISVLILYIISREWDLYSSKGTLIFLAVGFTAAAIIDFRMDYSKILKEKGG